MKKITKSKWQERRINAGVNVLGELMYKDDMKTRKKMSRVMKDCVGKILLAADMEEVKLVEEYRTFADEILSKKT